ncbi:hypothetical protein GCM10010246_03970 [Streptomyces cuspidosporus]|uniref:Uncharacterized protein n=1 Tax=Streptomyces cuspidosporus TaxID=66882 RepID=A0ABP5S7C2_9ACTN
MDAAEVALGCEPGEVAADFVEDLCHGVDGDAQDVAAAGAEGLGAVGHQEQDGAGEVAGGGLVLVLPRRVWGVGCVGVSAGAQDLVEGGFGAFGERGLFEDGQVGAEQGDSTATLPPRRPARCGPGPEPAAGRGCWR